MNFYAKSGVYSSKNGWVIALGTKEDTSYIVVVSISSVDRGVRYGFWYNSNGNVIFGLVGIPPAMEVQCNWIGWVPTQMSVQFWFYMVW